MSEDYLRKRFRKDPNMVHRRIEDEVILVPIRANVADLQGILYMLNNDVAARIWELIDGKRTVADILKVILEEFEVTRKKARRDLMELMQQLEACRGVQEMEEGAEG